MKTNIFLFLALVVLSGSLSNANVIRVSSASAILNANPAAGDTLLMDKTANWKDQDIILNFNGTEAKPIVLLAEGNGEVILSGGATLQIGGTYTIASGLTFEECASTEGGDLVKFKYDGQEAEYCRLTNSLFKNNNPSDLDVGYKWVSLYGENNRVDHCWFQEKKHRGTTLVVWLDLDDNPNYHRIDHNYFTRPLLTTGNNEAETIRIGDSQRSLVNSNTIVEYNYFEECDGEIESISNKSCYNVYRYNTFFNNASILTLRHGHYCTVENNYFFGNNVSGGGGVRIIGVGHKIINNYMQDLAGSGNLRAPIVIMGGLEGLGVNDATNRYVASEDNLVAFNTIVNCKQSIYIGSDKASSSETYKAPLNNTIDNNLIYGGDDDAVKFEYGEIASFNYAGNIFYNMTAGLSNGFTEGDPKFTFGSGLEPAKIGSGSAAIDAAAGNYSYTEDFEGQARTGTLDVGCDEYSSNPVLRTPVQKTEVGPCWLSDGACGPELPQVDCNGEEGGSASYDNCNVCSGGSTGVEPNENCEMDCSGTWGGDAQIDNCEICSGGTTGIAVDACLECGEAKSSSADGIHVATNATDDDPESRWSAFGEGEWIEVCLDDTVTIDAVLMSFYKGNERSTIFDVEVSLDGVSWTPVLVDVQSSGATLDKEEFGFTAVEAWKIRIIGKGNSSPSAWTSITKIEWKAALITADKWLNASNAVLYPNPTTGKLYLSTPIDASVEVFNIIGEKVLVASVSDIDISALAEGIYMLNINGVQYKVIKK